LDILVENHQNLVDIDTRSIPQIVEAVFQLEDISCDEVMIYFVDQKTICELHEKHFNDPSPTDCISIQVDPLGASPCFLGEIFISPQAAIDFCKEKTDLLYQEITLYLVHGLLHLIGYDDIETADQSKMRLAEKKCIDYLLSKERLISK